MTSPIPAARFGYGHPFWAEAVRLRQEVVPIRDILEKAHEAGYTDLKYSNIRNALAAAPADLHLPSRSAKWLQRKYAAIAKDFDSFQMMRDLANEAVAKIQEIDDELRDPDVPSTRKMYLEGQQWRWYGRAFDWALACSELGVKIQDLDGAAKPRVEGRSEVDVQAQMERMVEEFHKQLPAPPPTVDAQVIAIYGSDNVRAPVEGAEVEDREEDY